MLGSPTSLSEEKAQFGVLQHQGVDLRYVSVCKFNFSSRVLQIGQPHDDPIHNVTVENLIAENTGDDSIALFNVASGGVIRNCQIKDSFARGILLYNSRNTKLINNTVIRCPVTYVDTNEVDNYINP